MQKEKFKLDVSLEKIRFKEHLEIENNNQIIFSGIFGIGKTYFLKEFFENNKSNYESIVISPVNYSISNNDDIINYIKYDIIFQLLSKGIKFEKTDFSKGLTSQMYLKDNFLEVMKILAKNASKINREFGAIFDSLKEIKEKIDNHNKSVNVDDEKELINFLNKIKDNSGSIYEENRITILISKLISELKGEGKEIVLVIDDTDRLEPEHVFRILNVFACHFEFGNFKRNKFDFDKIILVCDIDNIRKMFYSKYGQEIDFSGYIDKFYSQEVFYLDNKTIIKNNLKNIFKLIKQDEGDIDDFSLLGEKNVNLLLNEIIERLISIDAINLRTLMNLSFKLYKVPTYHFKLRGSVYKSSNRNLNVFLIFDFLISLFGTISGVEKSLIRLSREIEFLPIENEYYPFNRYEDLIRFLRMEGHDYRSQRKTYDYKIEELDVNFVYELDIQGYRVNLGNVKVTHINGKDRKDFPFYQMLVMAFEKYRMIKKIN